MAALIDSQNEMVEMDVSQESVDSTPYRERITARLSPKEQPPRKLSGIKNRYGMDTLERAG